MFSVRRVAGRDATVGAGGIAPMSPQRWRVVVPYPAPAPCIGHVFAP
jgi:hypothetical protein